MTSTEPRTEQASDKVSLPTLTAMVVGSMIGSGVFLLPRRFGTETGVLGAIIAPSAPVSVPKRRGRRKTPDPIIEPTTIAVSVGRLTFSLACSVRGSVEVIGRPAPGW